MFKDMNSLETVQRRATKFILNDYSSDYKSRLLSLHLLPLMMFYELQDLAFFVHSLKNPNNSFDILSHVQFCNNRSTRSATFNKLKVCQPSKSTHLNHFYFKRLVHLWNSLPPMDLNKSFDSIYLKIKSVFWTKFMESFDSSNLCTFLYHCSCSKCSYSPFPPTFKHH